MPRPWRVHLIAVTVLIGLTLFVVQTVGDRLPVMNRDACLVLVSGYAVISLSLLVLRETSPGRWGRRRTHLMNRFINMSGSAVVIAAFWLAAPYMHEDLLLVVLVYKVGTVTIQVVSAVEPPPSRGARGLALLALPASIALYFAVHWQRFSPAMIPFAFAYAAVVLSLRDFLQRALDQAYEARQAAEAALVEVAAERDAKTRFLASAWHDLGQPLQAARLFFDQTMRSRTAPQRQTAAAKVDWAFDVTEQLLRQILDHLRLESGAVEPKVERLALGPLIARIAEMNGPAARLAGVSLVAMSSHLHAAADPRLTERIAGNLVANAIRHAKATRVLLGVRRQGRRLRLWVIDDGTGVSEADMPHLFDDYVQGSDHGDEIRGGFGLGLASARRMATLMGGTVGLDRNWRGGSAFWLELHDA